MNKPKPVSVNVLKHHTWRGKDYEPGDTYDVEGDASQTTDQYLDTLRATGFARPVDEEGGPNVVNEIGSPESATAVAPMSTESVNQPATPVAPVAAKPARAGKARSAAAKVARAGKPAASGGKKK